VFSDGDVWPTFRVEEAWAEGLDAIALTDHVEYQPKKDHVSTDRNASYRLAVKRAEELGMLLVAGAELTRRMPPGHMNGLFLQDANALAVEDWKAAVAEVRRQGGLIMWNHPGWVGQQPDGIARWYDDHTALYEQGALWGIEVANQSEVYPEVIEWCRSKNLAMLGSSDTHQPITTENRIARHSHRTMTLVFARERSLAGLREALVQKRTVVYVGDQLIGAEEWLGQVFKRSVIFSPDTITARGRQSVNVSATNTSEIPFHLSLAAPDAVLHAPQRLTLLPGTTAVFQVRATADTLTVDAPVTLRWKVTNLITGKDRGLEFPLQLRAQLKPSR
jgi:hypothetical protein